MIEEPAAVRLSRRPVRAGSSRFMKDLQLSFRADRPPARHSSYRIGSSCALVLSAARRTIFAITGCGTGQPRTIPSSS
jgi:hypothetical protein